MEDCAVRETTLLEEIENLDIPEHVRLRLAQKWAEESSHMKSEIEKLSTKIHEMEQEADEKFELPLAPIECATMLINASYECSYEYDLKPIRKVFGAGKKNNNRLLFGRRTEGNCRTSFSVLQ